MTELTRVEISGENLKKNIQQFRKIIGSDTILCPCVKANAYGHGLVLTSMIFLENGADWLAVNSLFEARALREANIQCPIYILGYVSLENLDEAVELDTRMVVYNKETIDALSKIAKPVKVHLKVETGNNRQGLEIHELLEFAKYIQGYGNIEIEGLATHFANIEDTTDHSYAQKQFSAFNDAVQALEEIGISVPIKHCANSAATMLFPETHFNMVRVGISAYGMWPSKETYVALLQKGVDAPKLSPAFTWKSRIAQIKNVKEGEVLGYGCTFKTTHNSRIAIIPVGYYDGYDRLLSNKAFVLIREKRAPVRGRVCMNIIMVDVTDIPEAQLEDEVILIGKFGNEEISAELFAGWADTINYEVTTRVNERIPRIKV